MGRTRSGTRLLPLALLAGAALLGSACGAEADSDIGAATAETRRTVTATSRGCPQEPWRGPWTACAEADWVRRVASDAGYKVVGETGSALLAEGRGDEFSIWTTPEPESLEDTVTTENWKAIGSVNGTEIYGDERHWRWWIAQGAVFWVKAGPHISSTVPEVGELLALVDASRTVERGD
jgi:hypothetical protein